MSTEHYIYFLVRAGIQDDYMIDSRNISVRKWVFCDQEIINDAAVVGLELKNAYDHLLAASTYGGYDIWYRSVPPVNSLILGAGQKPFVGFHYALEGGTTPPLQDVARAVANKIKSALPGWLGGGSTESATSGSEPHVRSEPLTMRSGLYDTQRVGTVAVVSPDRRLAAFVDSFGRVALLDVNRGHLVRLFKGCRDAQCAFVQLFEVDDKKPQLSVIKEIKRAIFLVIYNPKKGLIDIRVMQTGTRVAVFTATKNGILIYNTCGLVGADKNYTYKKLNLPEFQCILLDPDGKLKKFNIPFFFALDGEHSERSKDLHTLRELRDYVKKSDVSTDEYENELLAKVSQLKTLELRKHFLELMINNYNASPKVAMSCLNVFWNCFAEDNLNTQEQVIKHYFAKLGLTTLFYRLINDEHSDDMNELQTKFQTFLRLPVKENKDRNDMHFEDNEEQATSAFHLLEDDSCILERMLALAQEKDYKEQQQIRVTFADTKVSTYKEFVSCFVLDEKSQYICLKPDATPEKLNNLACITFKSIFKLKDFKLLTNYINECNIDPKEIVKLLIMQLMNMSMEEINIELIEKIIVALYYICKCTKDATNIIYNEISPWWENIRNMLVDMPCPLRSMIVAMTCKAVGRIFEIQHLEGEEEVWESVTKENAKWGILIGKLEDISILSIILMFKDTFKGESLPKLHISEYDVNLKYIYTRGKGSVTELIAKWLCGMGVTPEAIIANELMEVQASKAGQEVPSVNDDSDPAFVFIENNRSSVDENPKIFKWLSLLRRQFPLSTMADYIIANMCWEYSMAWQKCMQNTAFLEAVIHCLTTLSDYFIRLGLFSIIWSTYIKHIFELTCRLVNKTGKLPKDPLSLQEVGFDNQVMIQFLSLTTKYLSCFQKYSSNTANQKKQTIQFERIWDESMPSLVEVAQHTKYVDDNILSLNYQISSTMHLQCHFNIKFLKPLDTLYDIDYQYILEALTGNVLGRDINMKASEKVRNHRMKFLTKLIRAAVETISTSDSNEPYKSYDCEECVTWMKKIYSLAELWSIDEDFVIRQQAIALYHLGFDVLAENIITSAQKPELLLAPILAITTQRLKRSLERSSNQPEWIVTVPPHLYKRLQNVVLDTSIPANPSLPTTVLVLQSLLVQMDKKTSEAVSASNSSNIKLAELIIENCEVLIRRKL
ncbi:hypothetical protein O3G_MSEX000134 [Manduca sexta]|nr:hypothetical protein O3G_MSEX000134 [Manduca sexta]